MYAEIQNDTVCANRIHRVQRIHKYIESLKLRVDNLEKESEFLLAQIEDYEKQYALPEPSGNELLQFQFEQSGMTQAYVCRNTGVSPSRFSEYIGLKRHIPPKDAMLLSSFFDIPLEKLLKKRKDTP